MTACFYCGNVQTPMLPTALGPMCARCVVAFGFAGEAIAAARRQGLAWVLCPARGLPRPWRGDNPGPADLHDAAQPDSRLVLADGWFAVELILAYVVTGGMLGPKGPLAQAEQAAADTERPPAAAAEGRAS